jgi:hypothetical protein
MFAPFTLSLFSLPRQRAANRRWYWVKTVVRTGTALLLEKEESFLVHMPDNISGRGE